MAESSHSNSNFSCSLIFGLILILLLFSFSSAPTNNKSLEKELEKSSSSFSSSLTHFDRLRCIKDWEENFCGNVRPPPLLWKKCQEWNKCIGVDKSKPHHCAEDYLRFCSYKIQHLEPLCDQIRQCLPELSDRELCKRSYCQNHCDRQPPWSSYCLILEKCLPSKPEQPEQKEQKEFCEVLFIQE